MRCKYCVTIQLILFLHSHKHRFDNKNIYNFPSFSALQCWQSLELELDLELQLNSISSSSTWDPELVYRKAKSNLRESEPFLELKQIVSLRFIMKLEHLDPTPLWSNEQRQRSYFSNRPTLQGPTLEAQVQCKNKLLDIHRDWCSLVLECTSVHKALCWTLSLFQFWSLKI